MAELAPQAVVLDARMGGVDDPAREREADLSSLFPQVREAGHEVMALAVLEPAPDGSARLGAVVIPVGSGVVDGVLERPHFGLLACSAGDWALTAQPFRLFEDARVRLGRTEGVDLPGGGRGTIVRVVSLFPTYEANATAYLVGVANGVSRVEHPAGAPEGVLAIVGTQGERVVAEGVGDYYTVAPYDASGWYPAGGRQLYLRFTRQDAFDEEGSPTRFAGGVVQQTLQAEGLGAGEDESVWVLIGTGPLPAWCRTRTDVRRAPLTIDGRADDATDFTWVAGAWERSAAVPVELHTAGARFLLVGQTWDDEEGLRDPAGHEALVGIPIAQ